MVSKQWGALIIEEFEWEKCQDSESEDVWYVLECKRTRCYDYEGFQVMGNVEIWYTL